MNKNNKVVDVQGLTTNEKSKTSNGSKKNELKVCPICGKKFNEYGNNCSPLYFEEKCCDRCNMDVIIPIRLFLEKHMDNH
jgi:hypothetical protein